MKQTIYKSASMRSVAIHNLFNRTCIFKSIQDKDLNKERDYVFKDSRYEVHLSGKYLNHCTDYPLFGLIIAQWRNNLAGKVEKPEHVTVSLDAISNLIKIADNANREAQFRKIKDSLI